MRERVDLGAVRDHSILPLAFDEFPLGVDDTLPSLFPSFAAVAAIKYNLPNSNFHFPLWPARPRMRSSSIHASTSDLSFTHSLLRHPLDFACPSPPSSIRPLLTPLQSILSSSSSSPLLLLFTALSVQQSAQTAARC